MVDSFVLSWRPHIPDAANPPFTGGVGVQVSTSDPVFMQRRLRAAFPLDMVTFRAGRAAGDEQAHAAFALGIGWLHEANPDIFRSWEDLAYLCENRTAPSCSKGSSRSRKPTPRLARACTASSFQNHERSGPDASR